MSEGTGAVASGRPRPVPAKPKRGAQRKTSTKAPHERANHQAEPLPVGSFVVVALAMVWLAIDLGIAYKTIQEGVLASTQVALFLPSITAAALVAGAAIGVLAIRWLADRFGGIGRPLARVASGAVGGSTVGLIAAGGMLAAYHHGSSVTTVTITVAMTAVAGGALAAVRPTATIAAGLAGMLAYTAVSFVGAYFRNELLNVFGAGNTVGSYYAADSRLSLVVSIVTGIIGGATAYAFLRRTGLALPWPAYLGAGAVPGLLLLLAELAAWLGGAPLLRAVGKVSSFDRLAVAALQPGRINHEMIVFFAGTMTAIVLVGRTMRRPTDR